MTGPLGPILGPVGEVVKDVAQPVLGPLETAAGSAAAGGAIQKVESSAPGVIQSIEQAALADLGKLTGWEHAAALLAGAGAVAVGLLDLAFLHKFGAGVDGGLIAAGLAALGIKGTGVLPS